MSEDHDQVTVWVSKYALTMGLYQAQGRVESVNGKQYFKGNSLFLGSKHYHVTREEAVRAARVMQRKRVHSLEKQLDRVLALTFEEDAK